MKSYSEEMRDIQKKFSKSNVVNKEIMKNLSEKVAEKMKKSTKTNYENVKTFEDLLNVKYGEKGSDKREEFHKKAKEFYTKEMKQESITNPFKDCKTFYQAQNVMFTSELKSQMTEAQFLEFYREKLKELNGVNQLCFKITDAKEQVNSCKTIQDVLNIEYRKDMNCDATELYNMKNNRIAELVKELNNKQIINPFENCKNIADVLNVKFDTKYNMSVEQFNEKGSQVIRQWIVNSENKKIEVENKSNPFEHCKTMDDVRTIYWGDYVGENKLTYSEYLKFRTDKVQSILNKVDSSVKKNPFENCTSLKETYNILFDKNANLTPEEYFEFKKQTLLKFEEKVKPTKFSELDTNSLEFHKDGLDLFNNILKQLDLKNTSKLPKVHVVADFKDVEKIIQKLIDENTNHTVQSNEFGYCNLNPLTDEIKTTCIDAIKSVPLILNDIINDCGDLGYAIGKSLEIEDIELFIGGLKAAITDKKNG